MIYLASVYSYGIENLTKFAAEVLMNKRYEYAAKRTAQFMKEGVTVFCPINHCHPLAVKFEMPKEWAFWKKHDLTYIRCSRALYVLKMPHWKNSKGLTEEIKFARSIGLPIVYWTCEDYEEEGWL
jgi:hypothetical protein